MIYIEGKYSIVELQEDWTYESRLNALRMRSTSTSCVAQGNMSDDDKDFLDSLEKEASEYSKV
jgi:hypothetical protein